MTTASVCTIGDEILIGQIIDTNSAYISRELEAAGVQVTRKLSIGDDHAAIVSTLAGELEKNDVVICTGGLGPTKDDITKAALSELYGSRTFVQDERQLAIIYRILHSRGLEALDTNKAQALVPEGCEVIPNTLGTAPVMVFRFPPERFSHPAVLYSLPGVPFEALGALPDVLADIRRHFALSDIFHKCLMVYGLAESALSDLIAPWEDSLPEKMHLAYLPNPLTGVRLRLSIYGGDREQEEKEIDAAFARLVPLLGERVYSFHDDTLENAVGALFKGSGMTLSVAESCTGGTISSLLTSVPGASEFYLGSVISYAVAVKEKVLGVDHTLVERHGVVSAEVAAAMAEGVRRLTGSTYALATTGLAGPGGDETHPVGTVWIGVAGPRGTKTEMHTYSNDRKRNIERFSATALDLLRRCVISDTTASK